MSNLAALSLFTVFVLGLLALDLEIFHRRSQPLSFRKALIASMVWISLALAFNAGVYLWRGPQPAVEFLTGYVLELSLSFDNVFVFAVTFAYAAVPAENQHRVLFWGVLGAMAMRAVFIFAGVELVQHFQWALAVFGAFLVVSGFVFLRKKAPEPRPEQSRVLKLAQRVFSISEATEGARFFVRRNGRLLATPLFLVLVMVETTDVLLTVDSIPAVLGVTQDPFIVFTSNVFAVLGLRALYFVVARALVKFRYLHIGLALVLVFVGSTMLASRFYKLPTWASLAVICGILSIAIAISASKRRPADENTPAGGD